MVFITDKEIIENNLETTVDMECYLAKRIANELKEVVEKFLTNELTREEALLLLDFRNVGYHLGDIGNEILNPIYKEYRDFIINHAPGGAQKNNSAPDEKNEYGATGPEKETPETAVARIPQYKIELHDKGVLFDDYKRVCNISLNDFASMLKDKLKTQISARFLSENFLQPNGKPYSTSAITQAVNLANI